MGRRAKAKSVKGVFLSHSSHDKEFVAQLATDLVNLGFPVWFDSWDVETGDSLYNRIYEGIDASSFLILVLSPNSVKSRWVTKELNGALTKEEELGRKFVLPVKIGKCKVPLSIRDRIYADFSQEYIVPLENLERVLRKGGADKTAVPVGRQLIPLQFSRGLFLDEVSLDKRIRSLVASFGRGFEVSSSQLVLSPERDYTASRGRVARRLENLKNDPAYSPDWANKLRSHYDSIRRLESWLIDGTAKIMNGLFQSGDWAFTGQSCDWYARIIRSMLLRRIWESQQGLPDSSDYGKSCLGDPINYETSAKFYGVPETICCDIWKEEDARSAFSVFVDADSEVGQWFRENPQCPDSLRAFWSSRLIYEYVVPQMIYKSYVSATPIPASWAFEGYMIGLH